MRFIETERMEVLILLGLRIKACRSSYFVKWNSSNRIPISQPAVSRVQNKFHDLRWSYVNGNMSYITG